MLSPGFSRFFPPFRSRESGHSAREVFEKRGTCDAERVQKKKEKTAKNRHFGRVFFPVGTVPDRFRRSVWTSRDALWGPKLRTTSRTDFLSPSAAESLLLLPGGTVLAPHRGRERHTKACRPRFALSGAHPARGCEKNGKKQGERRQNGAKNGPKTSPDRALFGAPFGALLRLVLGLVLEVI